MCVCVYLCRCACSGAFLCTCVCDVYIHTCLPVSVRSGIYRATPVRVRVCKCMNELVNDCGCTRGCVCVCVVVRV